MSDFRRPHHGERTSKTAGAWFGVRLVLIAASLLSARICCAESEPPSALWRAITLKDHNTRVVLLGTSILGTCAGVVGAHLFLRRRALLGDVVSHAALPGVCIAFLLGEFMHAGSGKALSGLMVGAGISALFGVGCLELIRRTNRLPEDAALAIVLSLFFGLGATLLTVIQSVPSGSAAGLSEFIFGKPAGLLVNDVVLISLASGVVLLVCGLLWKELIVTSFDVAFARTQGWPVRLLDLILVLLVTAVTVIGMQCVGLLLIVALLVIPPASARFWTDRIQSLAAISAAMGAFSAGAGVILSAASPRLATGAVIVLCGSAMFVISLLFGTRRGLIGRWRLHQSALRQAGRHDLLRACFEMVEKRLQQAVPESDWTVPAWSYDDLAGMRNWSRGRLPALWKAALQEGLIRPDAKGEFHLTKDGARLAQAAARQHRLWELYLIRYANRLPVDVDRDADVAEHMLDPHLTHQLEQLLEHDDATRSIPMSPHALSSEAPESGSSRLRETTS